MSAWRQAAGILGMVAACWASACLGVTNTWTNAAGGRFDVPGNWDPAGPPGSGDTALFSQGSATRATITFPAGVTTTAGLRMHKFNADNKYEFAIADSGATATYEAGTTVLGSDFAYRADLLISTGTLVSTAVSMSGYDALIKIVLDGPGTLWRVNNTWSGTQVTMDLDIQNGARLEVQGAAGTANTLYTEALDASPNREQYIRVAGTGSALIMTNKPTSVSVQGHARFEVVDNAQAVFSDFALLAGTRPLITLVSNATVQAGNFTMAAASPNRTNIANFVNATVTCTGSVEVAAYSGYTLATLDNTAWTLHGAVLSVGSQDSIDGTTLTLQNGSRMIGTNAELRSQRGVPASRVVVTGTNTLLDLKSVYVSGSSGNLLPADNHGSVLTVSNGATVASAVTSFVYSNGILRLSGGTFSNAGTLGVVGVLEGDGVVVKGVETGNWPGGGLVRPGGSNGIGRLNIGNTFNQRLSASYVDGRLELEINGTEPGIGHDVLSVTNGVTLAEGVVAIGALPGYKPLPRFSTYDVVTGSSVSTNGATIQLPPDTDKVKWTAAVTSLGGGRSALRVTAEALVEGSIFTVR